MVWPCRSYTRARTDDVPRSIASAKGLSAFSSEIFNDWIGSFI